MFDIAWSEFMLIGAVALVVIGPKDLPKAMRTVGQAVGKIRRMASEFQGQFNDAMREAELHDLKKQVEDVGGTVSSAMNTDFKPIEMPASTGLDDAALKEAEAKLAALPPPDPLPPVEIAPAQIASAEIASAEVAPVAQAAAPEPAAEPSEPAPVKTPRKRKTAAAEPGEGSAA
ncbi:Sec-independent protein translocase protein TatB [Bosea sp. (in: a-proteobacteria)]|jgi:sec-independent protein translocase protein TatB|uniref:Sec-independent protein translocase protein TatB n=1 Tax=Bosea sp. (in: a-proteobacteria) TaxID=1871050 RepID=UPI002B483623|nr:Sec-independent protein translocase protein TatB [Bosea sp. (in: a-proteobacteria)]MBA4333757.1 twin-arginine translocase subunit TatB [Methylobacterium sp.]WRH59419.1 MAG: Sec-independent protein translocase protein TatB [Bosea sp. (in: a-proteobacteria)]